jgi:hypothetical protein
LFIEHENNGVELERALHRYAAEQIDQGHPERAIKALLAFNPG